MVKYVRWNGSWVPIVEKNLNGYLLEDWEGGLATGPSYQKTPYQFPEPGDSDSTVTTRQEWTSLAGSPSVTDGDLVLSPGASTTQAAETSAPTTVGTWEIDFAIGGPIDSSEVFTADIIREDGANRIRVFVGESSVSVTKREEATNTELISTSWTPDTDEHTIRVTRDANGNYELIFDGTSAGTATDGFLPAANSLALINTIGQDVTIPRVEVF